MLFKVVMIFEVDEEKEETLIGEMSPSEAKSFIELIEITGADGYKVSETYFSTKEKTVYLTMEE